MREEIKKAAISAWHNEMALTHRIGSVLPLSFAEITRLRDEKGMERATEAELRYRKEVGLCTYVCMSNKCAFFLENKGFKACQHYTEALSLSNGGRVITAFSIAVTECIKNGVMNELDIFEAVQKGTYMKYEDAAKRRALLKVTQDKRQALIDFIHTLIPRYRKLFKT